MFRSIKGPNSLLVVGHFKPSDTFVSPVVITLSLDTKVPTISGTRPASLTSRQNVFPKHQGGLYHTVRPGRPFPEFYRNTLPSITGESSPVHSGRASFKRGDQDFVFWWGMLASCHLATDPGLYLNLLREPKGRCEASSQKHCLVKEYL